MRTFNDLFSSIAPLLALIFVTPLAIGLVCAVRRDRRAREYADGWWRCLLDYGPDFTPADRRVLELLRQPPIADDLEKAGYDDCMKEHGLTARPR